MQEADLMKKINSMFDGEHVSSSHPLLSCIHLVAPLHLFGFFLGELSVSMGVNYLV